MIWRGEPIHGMCARRVFAVILLRGTERMRRRTAHLDTGILESTVAGDSYALSPSVSKARSSAACTSAEGSGKAASGTLPM